MNEKLKDAILKELGGLSDSSEVALLAADVFRLIADFDAKQSGGLQDLIAQVEADEKAYPAVWFKAWEWLGVDTRKGEWVSFTKNNIVCSDSHQYRRHPQADTILRVEQDKIDHAGYWWDLWQWKDSNENWHTGCKVFADDYEYRQHPHRQNIIAWNGCSDVDKNRWQCRDTRQDSNEWFLLAVEPRWFEYCQYRLRQKTIQVTLGGKVLEFPEPVRSVLEIGQKYFRVGHEDVVSHTWQGDDLDNKWLKLGLIQLDRQSAKQHLSAIQAINAQVAL